MTNTAMVHDATDACPSCATRLRISLEPKSATQFECPECGTPLVARRATDAAVVISVPVAVSADNTPGGFEVSQVFRRLPRDGRVVALVATATCGVLAISFLLPAGDDSEYVETRNDIGVVAQLPDDVPVFEAPQEIASVIDAEAADSRPVIDVATPDLLPAGKDVAASEVPIAALSELPVSPPDLFVADLLPASGGSSLDLSRGTETTPNTSKADAAVADQSADVKEAVSPAATVPPPAKRMSMQERLGISIQSFRQTKPVPLRELIRMVEQMCLIRVDASTVPAEQLDRELTMSLQQTTPEGILGEAGRKCGLRVIVDGASVRLVSDTE